MYLLPVSCLLRCPYTLALLWEPVRISCLPARRWHPLSCLRSQICQWCCRLWWCFLFLHSASHLNTRHTAGSGTGDSHPRGLAVPPWLKSLVLFHHCSDPLHLPGCARISNEREAASPDGEGRLHEGPSVPLSRSPAGAGLRTKPHCKVRGQNKNQRTGTHRQGASRHVSQLEQRRSSALRSRGLEVLHSCRRTCGAEEETPGPARGRTKQRRPAGRLCLGDARRTKPLGVSTDHPRPDAENKIACYTERKNRGQP